MEGASEVLALFPGIHHSQYSSGVFILDNSGTPRGEVAVKAPPPYSFHLGDIFQFPIQDRNK